MTESPAEPNYDLKALILRALLVLGPTERGHSADKIHSKLEWLVAEGFVEKMGDQFRDIAEGREYLARKKVEWKTRGTA